MASAATTTHSTRLRIRKHGASVGQSADESDQDKAGDDALAEPLPGTSASIVNNYCKFTMLKPTMVIFSLAL